MTEWIYLIILYCCMVQLHKSNSLFNHNLLLLNTYQESVGQTTVMVNFIQQLDWIKCNQMDHQALF